MRFIDRRTRYLARNRLRRIQMQFRVRLDEILPTKQAARTLPQELGRIERGEVEQLVLTTRNNPRAVIVSVSRFEELLRRDTGVPGGDQLAA
jgi:hypothetical protein